MPEQDTTSDYGESQPIGQSPALLIGLGGFGSSVANEVYRRLPLSRRAMVGVHAFDTNVNDILKLKHLGKDQITRTSTDQLVQDYLRENPLLEEWFPASPLLRRRTLTEGAGQVRVNSRLALRSALQRDGLPKLKREISRVFQRRGAEQTPGARVVIVSSLAGGTGAGMFLQTGLLLRSLLRNSLGRIGVLIRGVFVLPDVFLQTGEVDEASGNAMRANAYASLKELDALFQDGVGTRPATLRSLELEFDSAGNVALAGADDPYDLCVLFDYADSNGNNLGSNIDHYKEQVTEVVRLQVFSPLASGFNSHEDNLIRHLEATRSRGRLLGAGVARLIYPKDEIVEYLARRWTGTLLSEEWLRLDQLIAEEYRAYERDIQQGVFRAHAPSAVRRYNVLLEQFANAETPDPFFRVVHRDAHTLDEKGRVAMPKARSFLDALHAEIDRVLRGDEEIRRAEADCAMDDERLKDRQRAKGEVLRMEDALFVFKERVLSAVHEHKTALANDIVARDCDRPAASRGGEHQLNTWVLVRDTPMHPVAVRYFLFGVRALLVTELQSLRDSTSMLRRGIQDYEKAYDLDETEEFVELVDDRLRAALDQSFLDRLFGSDLKEFIEEYYEKSAAQLNRLRRYRDAKLRELVFASVLEDVRVLSDGFEAAFRDLRVVANELKNETNRLRDDHDGRTDRTRPYVMASAAAKDALWQRAGVTGSVGKLPDGLASRFYAAEYGRLCQMRQRGDLQRRRASATQSLVEGSMVAWCRAELGSNAAINLSVHGALEAEAEMNGKDIRSHIAERIGAVGRLADPLVVADGFDVHERRWGVSPRVERELGEDQVRELFGDAVVSEEFPDTELVFTTAQYGLTAANLRKCLSGRDGRAAGEYFTAYDAVRRALSSDETAITPHLDSRWHQPAYLADIDDPAGREASEDAAQALVAGIAYEILRVLKVDNQLSWVAAREGSLVPVLLDGRHVTPNVLDLSDALLHNQDLVEYVLEEAARRGLSDRDKYRTENSLSRHTLLVGCAAPRSLDAEYTNMLDAIARAPEQASDRNLAATRQTELLDALMRTLHGYILRFLGQDAQHSALDRYESYMESLVKELAVVTDGKLPSVSERLRAFPAQYRNRKRV